MNRMTIIWQYRSFILASVRREFQSKHQNSLLGAIWAILSPLAMIIIYTVIFSQIMKAKLPENDSMYAYSVYLCAGIISWGLFTEIITRSQTLFLDNANILKKLSFPRVILPIIIIINACLNFLIIAFIFLFFLLVTQQLPGWPLFSVIPVLIIQLLFSIGLGMILGVLNVFFRDIGQLFSIIIQFWFWLTPIVYPISILPEIVRPALMILNPMAAIINAYHTIFVQKSQPDWISLTSPLLIAILLCIIAYYLYIKHASEIVDEL